MANEALKIQMIGNWKKEMNTSLADAINYTYNFTGRSIQEACKHAIILMTGSAKTVTPQAKKNRTIQTDEHGKHYLVYNRWGEAKRIYKWAVEDEYGHARLWKKYHGWFGAVRLIEGRGLAKRSWRWGLKGLDKKMESKPIPGVGTLQEYKSKTEGGYILTNTLHYLGKILKPGWEQEVNISAARQVMGQARKKLEGKWKSGVGKAKGVRKEHGTIGGFFKL